MDGPSFFAPAPRFPKDAIFALTAKYQLDDSTYKVNLGQGTYRDGKGCPWVLPSVAEAHRRVANKDFNHEYLPILGLREFRDAACELALSSEIFATVKNKVSFIIQRLTIGSTDM